MKARKLAVFAIILDILTFTIGFGFIFIAIGHDANSATECTGLNGFCKVTPLGQWNSFPLASQCSTGNYTGLNCEMIGNTTYRNIVSFNTANAEAGLRFSLSAGCTKPSNTVGAFIQLEYANYSLTTHTNVSNFVDIGGHVLIDNSANWPCSGNLIGTQGVFPATIQAIVLRVVGSGGGGVGDNPRFSSVTANIYQQFLGVPTFQPISGTITTTGFTAGIRVAIPLPVQGTVNFQWIATNATSSGSCVALCIEHGSGSCVLLVGGFACNSAVTFPTAFIGTPNVVGSAQNTFASQFLPVGSINLLSAQALTV